jgi:hypothetical protein
VAVTTRKLAFAAWLDEIKGLRYSGCDEQGEFSFDSDEDAKELWVEFQNSSYYRFDNRLVQLRNELPKHRRKRRRG